MGFWRQLSCIINHRAVGRLRESKVFVFNREGMIINHDGLEHNYNQFFFLMKKTKPSVSIFDTLLLLLIVGKPMLLINSPILKPNQINPSEEPPNAIFNQ